MVYFAQDESVINGIVDSKKSEADKDKYGLRDEQFDVARNTGKAQEFGE
ncbi:MAG: hypothetical protein WC788_02815 [Candidatus Paceibacterota bacterium]|jgi:hypothetical protein